MVCSSRFKRKLCRVILVLDADHFLVAIYQLQSQWVKTKGFPTIVAHANGLVLAVSPEAKAFGIKRLEQVGCAIKKCSGLNVIRQQSRHNRPDEKRISEATHQLRSAVVRFFRELNVHTIEKSGSDEFFIDLTHYTTRMLAKGIHLKFDPGRKISVEGNNRKCYVGQRLANRAEGRYNDLSEFRTYQEVRLAFGAQILDEVCQFVKERTNIICSGGAGSNRLLAKLACKLYKPNAITALTRGGFYRLSPTISFRDITGFGGDLGDVIERHWGELKVKELYLRMRDDFPTFQGILQDRALEAKLLISVYCHEPVVPKLMDNGMKCGKKVSIWDKSQFNSELHLLAQSMVEKLQREANVHRRFANKFKFQYSFGKREIQRTFVIFPKVISDDKNGPEHAKEIYDLSLDVAVKKNPLFEGHLKQGINYMNFRVSETDFEKFGEIAVLAIQVEIVGSGGGRAEQVVHVPQLVGEAY